LTELVVVGAGGFASYVLDVAEALDFHVRVLVDDRPGGVAGSMQHGRAVSAWPTEKELAGAELFVAIGDNAARDAATDRFTEKYPRVRIATLVHPAASVSTTALLGVGSIVMAGAVIGRGATVGRGALVDVGAVLAHDLVAEDFSSFAAGVVTGGYVRVGAHTAVGLNSSILERIHVGSDVVIGAGSVVTQDVPDKVVAFGAPARVHRSREIGEAYLR
jgi:sugar O-acyltransferase (sialic acid O-acetyltransferase NeuD family)